MNQNPSWIASARLAIAKAECEAVARRAAAARPDNADGCTCTGALARMAVCAKGNIGTWDVVGDCVGGYISAISILVVYTYLR